MVGKFKRKDGKNKQNVNRMRNIIKKKNEKKNLKEKYKAEKLEGKKEGKNR